MPSLIRLHKPLAWLLAFGILLIPFCVVDIIPATDLPQHLHQVYLLHDLLAHTRSPDSPYQINYIFPGSLLFWFGLLFSLVVSSGWILAKMLAILPLALHFLIAYRHLSRYPSGLVTSSISALFLFSSSFYWGFFNFLLGWPFFLGLILLLSRARQEPLPTPQIFIYLTAIYLSHSLWFAMAGLFIFTMILCRQISFQNIRRIAFAAIPLLVASLIWFKFIHTYREPVVTNGWYWLIPLKLRLDPFFNGFHSLGGLTFAEKIALLITITLWLALSYHKKPDINPSMLIVASLLLLIYVAAPDEYLNSIQLSGRWLPFVFMCTILAFASNPISFPKAVIGLGITLIISCKLALSWRTFERTELSGLKNAVSHIEQPGRLLGLAYHKDYPDFPGRPFLQAFAYASVAGIRQFNFSFVEHGSSIVSYRTPVQPPWTPRLEWFPTRLRDSDLQYFDYLLVQSSGEEHKALSQIPDFQLCSEPALWRLYCRRQTLHKSQ